MKIVYAPSRRSRGPLTVHPLSAPTHIPGRKLLSSCVRPGKKRDLPRPLLRDPIYPRPQRVREVPIIGHLCVRHPCRNRAWVIPNRA